jgi:ribosomal protein S18 acetylase RimI-like enzyme
MEELLPYVSNFARLRGEYYIWNIQSRYQFRPEVFEKNLKRRGLTLEGVLATHRSMRETGVLSEEQSKKMSDAFQEGQWLVLLFSSELLAGCARLTHRSAEQAELHSVYVSPDFRGKNYGRTMVENLIQVAIDQGYEEILLDTMPFMTSAVALYRSLGFEEVKYLDMDYLSPEHAREIGVIFMKLKLGLDSD